MISPRHTRTRLYTYFVGEDSGVTTLRNCVSVETACTVGVETKKGSEDARLRSRGGRSEGSDQIGSRTQIWDFVVHLVTTRRQFHVLPVQRTSGRTYLRSLPSIQ